MKLFEFISTITIPVTLLTTASIVLVSVALATKKNRLATVQAIQSKDFGASRFNSLCRIWVSYFYRVFGDRILAKRQLLTIPIYTLVVSGIFFSTWIIYLYIFKNPTYSLSANLPIHFKQAVSDFYQKGIIASLLIDLVTIQLTKMAIRTGTNHGYYSVRFFMAFILNFVVAYFIFSIAVLLFRIDDMVRLYIDFAPNDPMPEVLYEPLANISSSLSLFHPQTFVYFTTQGAFTTYFMPEPLIFYCAVTAQISLISITLAYQLAIGLERLKNLCIGFVKNVGTPETNAYSVIVLVILGLICVPIIALSFLAILIDK
jgi:hypothetical protein